LGVEWTVELLQYIINVRTLLTSQSKESIWHKHVICCIIVFRRDLATIKAYRAVLHIFVMF